MQEVGDCLIKSLIAGKPGRPLILVSCVQEELEVLRSIYDGDECFKEISPTSFQYRVRYTVLQLYIHGTWWSRDPNWCSGGQCWSCQVLLD